MFLILAMTSYSTAQVPGFTRLDDCRITQDPGNSQGSALADIDNDGDIDLLIGNTSGFSVSSDNPMLLYKNERNGNFSRIMTGIQATDPQPKNNPTASFADVDNDGDWDLTLPCVFYLNNGYGEFTKDYLNSLTSGCGDQVVTWADINNDSHLDCYIWRQNMTPNTMYISNGNGTYTEETDDVAASTPLNSESISWADFDNDGDMDIFSANLSFTDWTVEVNQNACFINEEGSFSMMNSDNPLLLDKYGSAGGSWGDYDNDGDLDLFVSVVNSKSHLYQNDGTGNFTQLNIVPGEIGNRGFLGSDWGDFDNDGDLDLFVTSEQNDLGTLHFTHINMLLMNNGDGTFTECASGNLKKDGGHSCTLLDYDNDGDLDILVPNGSLGTPLINYIYSNDGNDNHWISISCTGTVSNTSAIGARVYIKATISGNPVWQMRELSQQTGIHSFSSPRFHFGLENAELIDSVKIRWPSGIVDSYRDIKPDHFYRAVENESLKLDLNASNYIEYNPAIEVVTLTKGNDTTINLEDHFRLVTGDSIPEGAGDAITFTLHDDENPDVLTSSLDGSMLTITAGNTLGTAAVKIEAGAPMFRERIDFLVFEVERGTGVKPYLCWSDIHIYPNPAKDFLNIELDRDLPGPGSIEFFDLSGKLYHAEPVEQFNAGSHRVKIPSLEKGFYIIRISHATSSVMEKLLVL